MADTDTSKSTTQLSMARWIVTILIGFIGCVFIWIVAPYNNFILFNSFISDDYLPVGACFVILVLGLFINPILWRFAPRYALNFQQMALILAMLLAASITPSQGLLRGLPYAITDAGIRVSSDKQLADAYEGSRHVALAVSRW